MSGASRVRGGFDSHAFPPLLPALGLAALLAIAAVPGAASAQAETGPPRGVQVVGPPDVRQARADSIRRIPWHARPRMVMARSVLVPGWGQVHNRAWLKAGLVAGAEVWLGVRMVEDQRRLDELLRALDDVRRGPLPGETPEQRRAREAGLVTEYNARLDQRLGRQWLFGAVLAYAMIDAYVDAHFRGFDIEFQNDPALPAGRSPDSRAGRPDPAGLRLSVRWAF